MTLSFLLRGVLIPYIFSDRLESFFKPVAGPTVPNKRKVCLDYAPYIYVINCLSVSALVQSFHNSSACLTLFKVP